MILIQLDLDRTDHVHMRICAECVPYTVDAWCGDLPIIRSLCLYHTSDYEQLGNK